MSEALLMGAVAYDPKVVTIWNGFRTYLAARGLAFDFVLYSNYERQVEDLLAGRIHAAWNSPLAWVRARRIAETSAQTVEALVMRDTDRDLSSLVVVRADGPKNVADLRGGTVAVGAVDSPQATLIPLAALAAAGLSPGQDVSIRRFDVGVGLHGDHIGGERAASRALASDAVDAACMIDGNHLLFARENVLPAGSTRVLLQTPLFDHCNMTLGPGVPSETAARFRDLLLGMSYADPEVRPLLDLEGLTAWCEGRTEGYAPLESAVDRSGFYDREGNVTATDYRP